MRLVVGLCWNIWKPRNLKQFNEVLEDPKATMERVNNQWKSIQSLNKGNNLSTNCDILRATRGSSNQVQQVWLAPPHGSLKINCDSSFSYSEHKCYTTYIYREHCGSLLHFNYKCFFSVFPLQVEMLAIREAIIFSSKYQNRQFNLELNCLTAISLCSSPTEVRPLEVDVIEEEI